MKQLPKISIVVPIYNVEEYIAECLQSVMRQTYLGPMECILVDGTGTDNSMAIAQEMVDEYKGSIEFRFVCDEYNKGLSGSRNTGISVATGDYIFFLDSDDYISVDCINTLVAPLQRKDYDMVVGNLKEFGGKRLAYYNPQEREIIGRDDILSEVCSQTLYIMAWNKLISMNVINNDNLQFIENILHEDVPWAFELGINMNSIYVIDHETYYYRIRTDSLAAVSFQKKRSEREYSSYVQGLLKILNSATIKGVTGDVFDSFVKFIFSRTIQIGFENNMDISKDYALIRTLYPKQSGLKLLFMNPKMFKKNIHWYLPTGIACRFLKWKYNRNKR